MAVPCGPEQKPAPKKREATRRATSDRDAKERPEEPTQAHAARPAAGDANKRSVLVQGAADDRDAKKLPEEPVQAEKRFVLQEDAADRDAKKRSVLAQGAAAADRDAKKLPEEVVQAQVAGPTAAADGEANTQFVLAQAATGATDRDAKKRSVLPQCASDKKRPELAREAGHKQQPWPVQAAVARPLATHCDAKNSPKLLEANAAATYRDISSSPDGGRAKELGARGAKNCEASSNSGGSSCENRTEFEGDNKKNGVQIGAGNMEASSFWKFISFPFLQQQRSHEEPEPDFLWKKTSLLKRLLECCGLFDPIIDDKDSKNLHVREKKNLVSEAKDHYKIKESVAEKLCEFYSSFRVVLGDGECFYRSFIYAYLELVLDNDHTSEENRLLCAINNVSSACRTLQWLYGDFKKYCQAFKELLQKIKSWKTETRAVRRTLLLTYFGDYKETEAIFSFLRIASAAWILTHPEFSAFHPIEDGTTIEEHCRSQIIQSRSYADNLAITSLAHAFGIQIQIFSLENGDIQDMCVSLSCESTAVPTVSLAYTGIHYDILYPR